MAETIKDFGLEVKVEELDNETYNVVDDDDVVNQGLLRQEKALWLAEGYYKAKESYSEEE